MYQTKLNSRTLRRSLLLGAASVAAIAVAAPAAAADQSVETVVVTGSRIPQVGLYSSSPVTAVGQEQMQLTGTTKVENLLNSLPSVVASNASTDSNGATGTATVDLRGLGPDRTLVLVNGNRLMPGDPTSGNAADLNDIPAALVDHVEVLTGGASSVYGSDALAGVVNFIMRKDFEGVEIDGSYSIHQVPNGKTFSNPIGVSYTPAPKNWWGGSTKDLSLILGTNTADGKGNITAYLTYRNVSKVLQKNLDYSACALWSDFYSGYLCGGSSNYNRWRSFDNKFTGSTLDSDWFAGSGNFVPWGAASGKYYNYGPKNYLLRPDTRYTGGFFGHYRVNKALDVYASMMFADDHTEAQIAESAIFAGSGTQTYKGIAGTRYYTVNCNNPLMTATENQDLCGSIVPTAAATDSLGNPTTLLALYGAAGPNGTGYDTMTGGIWDGGGNINKGSSLLDVRIRNVLGRPRIDDLRHTSYRMVVGARGELGGGWAYDFHGQYGTSLFNEHYLNDLSATRVEASLNVDPATGNCYAAEPNAQGVITDSHCVPWDVFNGFKAPPDYVYAPGFQQGYTEEQIVSGNVTGDLGQWGIQSPMAKSPVAVSFGAEYRAEYIQLDTNTAFQQGDLTGQGTKVLPVPRSGFNVAEGFGEIRIPVIQDMPMAEDLTVHGSYRYSSYSTVGSNTTYSIGAEWQPIDDIRFRASYSRAGRAPNVLELYSPFKIALFQGGDPCSSSTSAQCQAVWTQFGYNATTAAAALSCPASQCNQGIGGNSNLKAEKSDTLTLGAVLTPTFLPGFTATVDYFDIKVNNYIGTIAPGTSLTGCYSSGASAAAQAFYCANVHRSGATGAIYGAGYVTDTNANLPYISTKGIDFEATYTADLDTLTFGAVNNMGSLSAHFLGSWLDSYGVKPSSVSAFPGISTYDCAGFYGQNCGVQRPNWKHSLRMTWSTPWDVDLSVNWRYIGEVSVDSDTSNPLMGGGGGTTVCPAGSSIAGKTVSTAYYGGNCGPGAFIGSKNYFDLAFAWNVRDGVAVRGGVNNVLANRPPIVGSTYASNGNTWPETYDAMGRQFFISATIKY